MFTFGFFSGSLPFVVLAFVYGLLIIQGPGKTADTGILLTGSSFRMELPSATPDQTVADQSDPGNPAAFYLAFYDSRHDNQPPGKYKFRHRPVISGYSAVPDKTLFSRPPPFA